MNTLDVAYIRQLVREHSAIVLDDSKAYLVEGRLAPLAHDAGFKSLEALVQRLRSEPHGPLHQRVVEALATNETSFFRDPRVFEVIRGRLPVARIQSPMDCSLRPPPYASAVSNQRRPSSQAESMIANASSRLSPCPKNAGVEPIPPKLPQPSAISTPA